jgi:hypothetical protein
MNGFFKIYKSKYEHILESITEIERQRYFYCLILRKNISIGIMSYFYFCIPIPLSSKKDSGAHGILEGKMFTSIMTINYYFGNIGWTRN